MVPVAEGWSFDYPFRRASCGAADCARGREVLCSIGDAGGENSAAIADFCADLVSGTYRKAADCYGRVGIELVPGIVNTVAAAAIGVRPSLFDRVAAIAVYSDPVAAVRGRAAASD